MKINYRFQNCRNCKKCLVEGKIGVEQGSHGSTEYTYNVYKCLILNDEVNGNALCDEWKHYKSKLRD